MQIPPNLRQLLDSKQGRIKLAAGAVGMVLLLMLVSGGGSKPQQQAAQEAPVVAEEEKPLPPAPPNADNSSVILELFNPSDESLTHQRTETTYSQQIEQTLTMTYVLTKCLLISQDDYTNIFRALILYAERVKLAPDATWAESRVREIAQSANASYALIYSRTSCTDAQLQPLAKDILQWANGMFITN